MRVGVGTTRLARPATAATASIRALRHLITAAALWLIVLIPAAAVPAFPAAASAIPAIALTAGRDAPDVAPYLRYTKDPSATPARAAEPGFALPLSRISGDSIHFGPPGERTVVLLRLRNVGGSAGSWIFTTGRGSLKYFRMFEIDGNRTALVVDGNDPASARANLGSYQAFSTEIVLDPGQEKVIGIEFVSENSTYMPFKILTYRTFFKERRENIALVAGVVVGAAMLLLLNFLFFSITGFREFLWLAVAEAFVVLNTIHSEGYFTIFLLYDKPLTSIAIEQLFKCGFAAAMAQFARSFVKTKTYFPRRDKALRVLIGLALVVIALQPGLAFYPPDMRFALHATGWLVAIAVALFLPFVAVAAMRQFGFQLWPLLAGWASLAGFIIYSAIASMGIFAWLPINWHLAGPITLFETMMVTLALGLNLRKIRNDKLAADANYARSLIDQLEITEQAKRFAEEKAQALEIVHSQNALLHASGHDSRQVILALNSAVAVLRQQTRTPHDGELIGMLETSADYLNKIVATTISGANIASSDTAFVVLGAFPAEALLEPLLMMFRTVYASRRLTLDVGVEGDVILISDKPLLMRALANLLSNSFQHTLAGGARVTLVREGACAVIEVRDTGRGMPAAVMAELNSGIAIRMRGDETAPGTGSGFRSARRIIELLHGTLRIVSSASDGTVIRITLPSAFARTTPMPAAELQARLEGWRVLDFDDREGFAASLDDDGQAGQRAIAITYDDTAITRGRLSEIVELVAIKPICRELLDHPLLVPALQQV